MSDPADCRPICVKCGDPVAIEAIGEEGWIQLERHECKPPPRREHRGITRDWNYVCTDNDCWCWGSEHHNPRR